MPSISIKDIIQSERAKTVEQALAVVQHVRATAGKMDKLQLDFSGIIWLTSMFADRLVKALATYYGPDFENKIQAVNIEPTNVMFESLWESAVDKFRLAEA